MTNVRALRPEDRAAWEPLWEAYLAFYRKSLDPAVTDAAFWRLAHERDGTFGLLATEDDAAIGLAHVVTHPSTWTSTRYAYLEDLFVSHAARGTGAAKALFEAVYARADGLGIERVYWHTQEFNGAARSLYDQVGHPTSFVVYER